MKTLASQGKQKAWGFLSILEKVPASCPFFLLSDGNYTREKEDLVFTNPGCFICFVSIICTLPNPPPKFKLAPPLV